MRYLLALLFVACTHKPLPPVAEPELPPDIAVVTELPTLSAQVYFDFNSDSLADPAALRPAIDFLLANPAYALYVDGYADSTGRAGYNDSLSQRRADRVWAAITEIAPPRMGLSTGHGEAEERTVIIRVVP